MKKESDKKKVKKIIAVLAAIAVLSALILLVIELLPDGKNSKKDERELYFFYPADYESDIFENEEFLKKNRNIKYISSGLSVSYDIESFSKLGEAQAFLADYFSALWQGDEDRLNEMFTKEYFEDEEPYGDITMQKIYNISVEDLGSSDTGTDTTTYYFSITYMIMENDGTFRRDLDSDAERPLYFEIISDKNGIMINYIDYYHNVY